MTKHTVPLVRRLGWRRRGLWPDRNPLRRAYDRVEAVIVAVLLALFLIGGSLLAVAAGQHAYAAAYRTYAQQAAWHRIHAVVVSDPLPAGFPQVLRVSWPGPDGTRQVAGIAVPPGAAVGSTVPVWVDASGRLAGPPLSHRHVLERTMLAVVSAPAVLGIFLLAIWLIARRLLDRRRLAAWDAEWRTTGPQWTSRS